MQLNWVYTTLSIVLFAVQLQASNAQYTSSSSVYTPPPTSPYEPPPTSYPPSPPTYGCTPSTVTVTSITSTTLTSITTTTTTALETIYSGGSSYGYYDNTYVRPIKKKSALIVGLVVGICGLALLLLIALLLYRRSKKNKVDGYGKEPKTTYGEGTTPATSY